MGKKYLLYIHNPGFELELEKSKLVNLLLDRHYDYFKPGTLFEDVETHEDLDGSVVGSVELASVLTTLQEESEGTCKNGHFLQPGRDKCSIKGCRYSG
jgi:hypothetical protein